MPINPLIPMSVESVRPDIAVASGLQAYNQGRQFNAERDDAALRNSLLQKQSDTQQTQAARQELSEEEKSVIQGSFIVKQLLDAGDTEGARAAMIQRRDALSGLGLNTKHTDNGLVLLDKDPARLKAVVDANVNYGIQTGILGTKNQGVFAPQAAFDAQGNPVFIQGDKSGGISTLQGYRPYTPTLDEKTAAAIRQAQGLVPIKVEEAGGKRQAEADVDIVTKPIIAGAEASAKQAVKTSADQADLAKSNATAMSVYEAAISNVLDKFGDTSTGPVVGRLPAITASQQIADGAQAAMAPVLKQIFRVSGEGTFTDKDQDMLMAMLPTRKDHPETAKAKVQGIDAIVRAKLVQGQQSAPQQSAPQTMRFDAQGNQL